MAPLVGAVRTVFESDPAKSTVADLGRYIDNRTKVVRAITGEIETDYGVGVYRIDAPKAQGAVGFLGAAGPQRLTDLEIACRNPYAAVLAVALDDRPLKESEHVLVQIGTVARPSGWTTRPARIRQGDTWVDGQRIVDLGQAPWQVQSIDATVTLANPRLSQATALDPNGMPTAAAVPVTRVGDRLSLALNRQLTLLGVSKSSYYLAARPRSDRHAFLTHLVTTVYQDRPHYGYRRMAAELSVKYEVDVGEARIRAQMRQLGLRAIIRRRRIVTTVADPDGRRFANLLQDLRLQRSNQAWGADITYTAAGGQRAYVVAIKDLYSRKVLAWRVSNTMDASFCVEALEDALGRYGKPGIFHSDQGSQFTSRAFVKTLEAAGVRISQTGKGRAADNGQMENLWYSLKYEGLKHVQAANLAELRQAVNRYFIQYNGDRPHSTSATATRTPSIVRAWTASPKRLARVYQACSVNSYPSGF